MVRQTAYNFQLLLDSRILNGPIRILISLFYFAAHEKSKFDEWVQEIKEIRVSFSLQFNYIIDNDMTLWFNLQEKNVSNNKEKQTEVQTVYKNFVLEDNQDGEWLNKEWLKKWLESGVDKLIPEIDNQVAYCPHKK